MEGVKHLHGIDFGVIAGYFLIMVLIGSWVARFSRRTKDCFTAGANLPWLLAAISFWMATLSSLAFVTYSELGYKYGLTAIVLYNTGLPAMLVGALVFVRRWRRARQVSPIGFIETRFNPLLGQVFVWTGIPLRVADNAIRIYATAIFLAAALSVEFLTMTRVIWLTGMIGLVYSFLGGQWSVIVTDFVQFVILALAVFMVLPLSIREVGGFGTFLDRMPAEFTEFLQPPYDLYQVLVYIVFFVFTFDAGWTMIQKYNCVRSEKDARKLIYAVMTWTFLSSFIFFLPPMFSRVVFPELENARFSYAYMSLTVLPVGMMGVMIAAIFSATLSTLSNEYTMLSAVLTNDFYARVVRPGASETHLITVARINTVITGVLTTLIAVGLQHVRGMNLFDIMMKAYTAFAPAIMTPLLAGILIRRLNSRGALAGIVAGFVSGTGLLALNIVLVGLYGDSFVTSPRLNYWLNQGWTTTSILVNFAVTIAAMWIGNRSAVVSDDEKQRVDAFFELLKTPYPAEGVAAAESPFPMVGISLAVMGLLMAGVAVAVRFLYPESGWFALNMTAAGVLVGLGSVVRIAGGIFRLSR